jgi:hypothetical protein
MIEKVHTVMKSHGPGVAALAVVLTVYAVTASRSVGFIDSGELSTVACTLGIAHPTGYPLFTLLGWLFSRLPIASEEIIRLNLFASVLTWAGMAVFYANARSLIRLSRRNNRDDSRREQWDSLAAAGGTLMTAFSKTVWSQAVAIEVYALHILFVNAVLFLFLRALTFRREGDPRETRTWLLFGFMTGLSFTNHMTTIMLAPGLIIGYFLARGVNRSAFRLIGRMTLPFLLGLSVYLYLPVRGRMGPVHSWGDPVTLERFLWHVSGKQYSVWIFSSFDSAFRQCASFVSGLPGEFAGVGILFGLVGLVDLWRRNRNLAITTVLLFVVTVGYASNYDIHDIDSYFLLAYLSLGLWAAVGINGILAAVSRLSGIMRWMAVCAVVAASAAPLVYHAARVNMSGHYVVEDYTRTMFASLEPRAMVLSFQWDSWVSASYYYQTIRGVRPDVVVIDKELLRRSWYLTELNRRFPWLIARSQRAIDMFSAELYKFEHGVPYNATVIQARFVEMINSFIRTAMVDRPVYVTPEIEAEFTRGLQRVPSGLAFRLYADTLAHDVPEVDFTFRPFPRRGAYENQTFRFYSQALAAKMAYLVRLGRRQEAESVARKSADLERMAFPP